jgi:hypothetical protein
VRFSVSDLLPFLECNYKGTMRFQHQRWVEPTASMRLGTTVHKLCQNMLTGGALGDIPELVPGLEPMLPEIGCVLSPPPFECLAVEHPLQWQMGRHMLVGRLDAIGRMGGRKWSIQWKTLGKGRDLGMLLEKVRMSTHEIAYRSMYAAAYGEYLAGTALGVFRTYRTKQQLKDGVPIFSFHELPVLVREDEEAWEDIRAHMRRFIDHNVAGAWSPKNWSACFSSWGTCPLLEHCHHGADWQQLLPAPLADRYTDLPPGGQHAPAAPSPTGQLFSTSTGRISTGATRSTPGYITFSDPSPGSPWDVPLGGPPSDSPDQGPAAEPAEPPDLGL